MSQVSAGDFVLSGIDARNGAFGIVPDELEGAVISNDFWCLDVDEERIDKHFFYFLTTTPFFDHICKQASDGTTQRIRLQAQKFFNYTIELPPITEQIKILKKLQSIKSRSESLLNELTHQQTLLTRLRQSILQEAVRGQLTAQWRQANPHQAPASELLRRIQAEKAALIKKGIIKEGNKQAPETLNELMFEIPESWTWIDLDDITQYITDGTHQTPIYKLKGRIFLSAQNIKPFRFIPEDHKFISEDAYQEIIKNKLAEKGDILVARVGAGIGEAAVIDREIEFGFYVSLGLVKTFKALTNSDYLTLVFNSPFGVGYSKGNISSKGGSAGNFNLGRIRSFPFPSLPSPNKPAEQGLPSNTAGYALRPDTSTHTSPEERNQKRKAFSSKPTIPLPSPSSLFLFSSNPFPSLSSRSLFSKSPPPIPLSPVLFPKTPAPTPSSRSLFPKKHFPNTLMPDTYLPIPMHSLPTHFPIK